MQQRGHFFVLPHNEKGQAEILADLCIRVEAHGLRITQARASKSTSCVGIVALRVASADSQGSDE